MGHVLETHDANYSALSLNTFIEFTLGLYVRFSAYINYVHIYNMELL